MLHPLENSASFLRQLPHKLAATSDNFGTTLAKFHKKLDVNLLFQLLIDLHLDNG
jgi:hypothetical protein